MCHLKNLRLLKVHPPAHPAVPIAAALEPVRLPAGSFARERILGTTRYVPPSAKLTRCLQGLADEGDAFATAAQEVLSQQASLPVLAAKRLAGLPAHGRGAAQDAGAGALGGGGKEACADAGEAVVKKKARKKRARYEGVVQEDATRTKVPHEARMAVLTGRG